MKISLCMIVKDEQQLLARCLDSVRHVVDEMVIVDTGSRDRTREIASSYGARMVDFTWTNDFAAARNVALGHASGDWILCLDADELLKMPVGGSGLDQLAAADEADAYSVPIQNNKLEGGFEFHYAIRFFRKLPGIRFIGKVHERVDESLFHEQARIRQAPFSIEHTGYAIPPEEMEEKLKRNAKLLQDQIEQDPGNCFAHYYLGLTWIGLKEFDKSFLHLRRARQLGPATINLSCLIDNILAYHYLDREDYLTAATIARRSLRALPEQNTAKLFLGIALFNQGSHREALPLLRAAYQFLRLPIESRRTQLSQEHSYNEADLLWALTRSAAETGDYEGAFAYVQQVLRLRPGDAKAYLAKALCCLSLDATVEARTALARARHLGLPARDLAWAALQLALKTGDLNAASAVLMDHADALLENDMGRQAFATWVDRYVRAGKEDTLFKLLLQMNQQHSESPAILDALAFTAIRQGRYLDARRALERLSLLVPSQPDIMKRLAGIYLHLGQRELAARMLQKVRAADLEGLGSAVGNSYPLPKGGTDGGPFNPASSGICRRAGPEVHDG
ncbi:MAG: hypothetical protein AUK55_00605 [Syntrophobacteraceae bacterium CG2_30_61_12]|nr:MAG: hypothetical protein AUK55_00605 [Syntrophobacteraceae bacterium CG2_30_61_12]